VKRTASLELNTVVAPLERLIQSAVVAVSQVPLLLFVLHNREAPGTSRIKVAGALAVVPFLLPTTTV